MEKGISAWQPESVLKLFLSPVGRIRRLPFLYGLVASFLLMAGLAILISYISADITTPRTRIAGVRLQFITRVLLHLLYSWFLICLMSKRLRDLGLPGRLSLFQLLPTVVAIVNYTLKFSPQGGLTQAIQETSQVIYFVLLATVALLLLVWPGTKGPNRYGPPPGQKAAPDLRVFE